MMPSELKQWYRCYIRNGLYFHASRILTIMRDKVVYLGLSDVDNDIETVFNGLDEWIFSGSVNKWGGQKFYLRKQPKS